MEIIIRKRQLLYAYLLLIKCSKKYVLYRGDEENQKCLLWLLIEKDVFCIGIFSMNYNLVYAYLLSMDVVKNMCSKGEKEKRGIDAFLVVKIGKVEVNDLLRRKKG